MKDVPVFLSAIGTVIALESVTVKTQINGELIKVFLLKDNLLKGE